MERHLFLKWWLIFSLAIVGSVLAYITGLFSQVNDADFTKISFMIFGLFIVFSIRCGINTAKIKEDQAGWFVSDIMITLGMICTVVGFIYMLSTCFGAIDTSQPVHAVSLIYNEYRYGHGPLHHCQRAYL